MRAIDPKRHALNFHTVSRGYEREERREGEISTAPLPQVSENSTQQKATVGNHRRRSLDSKCSLLLFLVLITRPTIEKKNSENGEWEIRRNASSLGCYSKRFFARSRERLMRNLKRARNYYEIITSSHSKGRCDSAQPGQRAKIEDRNILAV